jgi:hypothetical protein
MNTLIMKVSREDGVGSSDTNVLDVDACCLAGLLKPGSAIDAIACCW